MITRLCIHTSMMPQQRGGLITAVGGWIYPFKMEAGDYGPEGLVANVLVVPHCDKIGSR